MTSKKELQMTMLNGYIHVRPVPLDTPRGSIAVSSKPHPDLPIKATILDADGDGRDGEVVLYLPNAGIPLGDGSFIIPDHAILCVLEEATT